MGKPKFYQAKLEEVKDPIGHVYSYISKENRPTMKERMGNEEAKCPECNDNKWWILPEESVAISQGGKAYCECLGCGYQTHL